MKRQTLKFSLVLALCLVIGSTMCFAAELNFSDVNDHWAKEEIYSMANKWVILGYPDGTFKPDDNIIKTHAFLMFARLNGYFDTENEIVIHEAIENYEENLMQDGITNGVAEIAFLIESNVISYDDVVELLGNGKENENLTRQEAAYIYVKLLHDEEYLNRFPLVPFDDATQVQQQYAAYVEYVSKIGLMIGYDNKFSPNDFVTRAQVATILSRIDEIIYERTASKVEGLIDKYDLTSNIIQLDVLGDIQTYILSKDLAVYENDKKVSRTTLKENDSVVVYLNDGLVEKIVVNNVEKNIYAKYVSYSMENDKVKIKVQIEGQEYTYPVLKDVEIFENDNVVQLEKILAGRDIEILVVNGSVSKIIVGAFSNTKIGMIEQIVIGKTSYISIKDLNGEINKYEIAKECSFDFDGIEGNIYDLRLDMDVKMIVTHNGVTKIKVETLTDIEVISGLVGQILPNIFVFTMNLDNGQVQMMFLDEEETIIKTKNGLAQSIYDIKENDLVSVYGRYEGDVFYPIQVIIY